MAKRSRNNKHSVQGGTTTSNDQRLATLSTVSISLLTINYLLLVPWITFSIPPADLFGQSILVAAIIIILGEAGMMTGNRKLALVASSSLLLLILWSKAASDINGLPSPDTAVLLLQFLATIFLMEASATVILYRSTSSPTEKSSHMSEASRVRLNRWALGQLTGLAKLFLGAFLLSLGLVVVGSIISVSVNQLFLTGALALGAVVAILFLLTYRREPENEKRH